MKSAYVLALVLPAALLVGCNMQNNGETPPPGELPTPYPSAQSGASTSATTPTPAASTAASTTNMPSAGASVAPAASTVTTATSAGSGSYTYDAAKGKRVYASTCSVCHQPTGKGIVGTFPPLKGNPVVNNPDATEQIHIVLDGTHGAKTINGVKYNGVMPPLGSSLGNEQIANLINYERSSWGNHARHTTPAQVAKVRTAGK